MLPQHSRRTSEAFRTMKTRWTWICLAAAVALGGETAPAAAPTNDASTVAACTRLREQWRQLTPEQKQARLRELRQQRAVSSGDFRQFREELRNLSPAERQAKMQEFLRQRGLPAPGPDWPKRREELSRLSPEERRAKIQAWRRQRTNAPPELRPVAEQRRALLRQRLEALRLKKANGTLAPEEARQLDRLERALRFLQSPPAAPPPGNLASPPPAAPPP